MDNICDKYLDYENFQFIFGNLEDYAVIDGGKEGGYLIRSVKNVLQQSNSNKWYLRDIVAKIRSETLRLVKGEEKKWKSSYKQTDNPARQIVYGEDNIVYDVMFEKKV